ncbi:MAG: sugar phosphate isomerase/epimerase family protein [Eubacteriales bacterium]
MQNLQPGTMTNLFYTYKPGQENVVASMRRLHKIGFKVIDLCMCPMQRNEFELCEDENWERFTDNIGNEAARLGLSFAQCHPVYARALCRRHSAEDEGCEKNEFFVKMLDRSLDVASRLGIPWAVMHPLEDSPAYDLEHNTEYNFEIYAPFYEKYSHRGLGFAFENMADVDGGRRFGVTPSELGMILDRFGDRKTGVCWDTGHANRIFKDAIAPLKAVGDRLVCTHIDDNVGATDLHQIPFMGTVPWKKVMETLKEIDYKGAFIYELSTTKKLPEELKEPASEYAYKVAEYLCKL